MGCAQKACAIMEATWLLAAHRMGSHLSLLAVEQKVVAGVEQSINKAKPGAMRAKQRIQTVTEKNRLCTRNKGSETGHEESMRLSGGKKHSVQPRREKRARLEGSHD